VTGRLSETTAMSLIATGLRESNPLWLKTLLVVTALGSLRASVWNETVTGPRLGSKQWAAVRMVRESINVPVQCCLPWLSTNVTTLGNWFVPKTNSGLPTWASLMVMARAGWLTDSARAAVPPSRIAERRAIAPERLSDDLVGSRLPSLQPWADLTRIAPSSVALPVDGC
jgi:hypothetical protein